MPSDIDSHVYCGLWTDWSRGPVLGVTLTMSRSNANLLIAFTAFFIAFTATRFWRLACLVMHRSHSEPGERRALYHQEQVILRNSTSPESGLWELLRLSWAWRKLGPRLIVLLPATIMSLFTMFVFTLAGGFSSRMSTALGDVVLIESENCGFLDPKNQTGQVIAAYTRIISNAANYAQQCYSTEGSSGVNCGRYVTASLPWTVDPNAPCPFPNTSICRTPNSNIRLDSGHINTNDALGLNALNKKRSSVRRVLHCAPLVTEGYTSIVSENGENLIRYDYTDGKHPNMSTPLDFQDVETQNGPNRMVSDLGLWALLCAVYHGMCDEYASDIVPTPDLWRPDGDLTISFLSGNGVRFHEPTEDEWYRATTPVNQPEGSGWEPYYVSDEAASPMGCIEQYQFCNLARDTDQCGPLASLMDAVAGTAPSFNLTPEVFPGEYSSGAPGNREGTRLLWMLSTQNYYPLTALVQHLGSGSLLSRAATLSGRQWMILPDQWKQDVTHWFATGLAIIQSSYIDVALGFSDESLKDHWVGPQDNIQRGLCESQKMRSSQYASFTVFGLFFTYVVGGVIIVIGVAAEPVLEYLHEKRKYQSYEQLEWVAHHHLQLQRLAYEDLATWQGCDEFIPVTDPAEMLPGLDISDPKHPTIPAIAGRLKLPEDTGGPLFNTYRFHRLSSKTD